MSTSLDDGHVQPQAGQDMQTVSLANLVQHAAEAGIGTPILPAAEIAGGAPTLQPPPPPVFRTLTLFGEDEEPTPGNSPVFRSIHPALVKHHHCLQWNLVKDPIGVGIWRQNGRRHVALEEECLANGVPPGPIFLMADTSVYKCLLLHIPPSKDAEHVTIADLKHAIIQMLDLELTAEDVDELKSKGTWEAAVLRAAERSRVANGPIMVLDILPNHAKVEGVSMEIVVGQDKTNQIMYHLETNF